MCKLKRCWKCKIEKVLNSDNFHQNKSKNDGFSTECKVCANEYAVDYKITNPDKIKAGKKDYYQRNKDKINADNKLWRLQNQERVKECAAKRSKRWQENNKNLLRIRRAARRAINPQKYANNLRNWRLLNPDKVANSKNRHRSIKFNADGSHTTQQWLDKIELFGGFCFYCGEQKPLTRDHGIPLSRGGSDSISNIIPACRSCNSSKFTKTTREFLIFPKITTLEKGEIFATQGWSHI